MQTPKAAAAFVAAQKAFGPAIKKKNNGHFGSLYADLASCIDAVMDALNANGLGLLQVCHECPSGVLVETLLIHESGEQISGGKLHVPASKQDPQGYGSALTYARRYSLMAAMGIAPEDDDGSAASGRDSEQKPYTPAKRPPAKAADPRISDAAMHIIGLHKEQNDTGLKAYLASLGKDAALKSQVWAALPAEVKTHIQSMKGDK